MGDAYDILRAGEFGRQGVQNAFDLGARQQAGNALAGGDYSGGANALFRGGLIDEGSKVQDQGYQQQTREDAKRTEETKKRISFLKQAASALSQVPDDGTQTARKAALNQHVLPAIQLMLQGDPSAPQTLQALQSADLSNTSLQTFMGELDKAELEIVNRGEGAYDIRNKRNGALVERVEGRPPVAKPDWKEVKRADGSSYWKDFNAVAGSAPAASPQGTQSAPAGADEAWKAMIQRESGGRPGVLGPQTRFGRAEGMTQMLPATAQAVAKKLGIAWRPDLMRATTPEGAAYQEKLGRAYYDEGLQKYSGDPNKAAMYYHGGPDEKLWGPKTRAYAQAVAPGSLQGGAGSDTLPPGIIEGDEPQAEKGADRWEDLPGGGQVNTKTGKKEGVPGSDKAPTEAQSKAVNYSYRVIGANDRLNTLIRQGITKPTALKLVSERNGVSRLVLSNPNDRRFVSAAKEWLAPILRKDTGAAVSDTEFLYYADIYIPQPEDPPALLEQKARARQDAMVALVGEAGPLFTKTYGQKKFRSHWAADPKSGFTPKDPISSDGPAKAPSSGGWSAKRIG